MKVAIRAILLLLGLALFAWFVQRAGPGEIWKTCLSLGWFAPLALLPYGIVYIADTVGWKFACAARALKGIGFWTLYRARWCGEAVNNVIPSAYIGGEAVKVYLLHKRGADAGDVAASVIVGRSLQTLTQLIFIVLGSTAFLSLAPAESGVRKGLLLVIAGGVVAVFALFWLQSRGLFSMLFRVVEMFGMKLEALEAKRSKLKRVDELVVEFYRQQRGRLLASGGGYMCGWLLDTMDIFLVSWLVGMPITWTQALAIEAFVGVAKVLGIFVPGAIGVQESGIAMVGRLAGLPDALAISYAIIRRGREVIYASIGWLLLYAEEASIKGISGRIAGEVRTEL